jgi:hypothetical protein
MALSEKPTYDELVQLFAERRRPTYDEAVALTERIRALVDEDGQLHVVELDDPVNGVFTLVTPTGGPVSMRAVGQFYTFHTVNWAHTTFRPTLPEVFATMPAELRDDLQVVGVSVRMIYGTTDFENESWHVGLATAYAQP